MTSTTEPPLVGPAPADRPEDRLDEVVARLRAALGEDAVTTTTDPAYTGDRAVQAAPGTRFALVRPGDVDGVRATLRIATETRTPVVPRGAGSGLSGGAVPLPGGIVLGLERLDRIREIDVVDGVAVVEAGVITADLDAAAREHGLFYAPDPASVRISSIGGNIATNAGGLHCAKYGVTRESVLALEVVLADGTLVRTGHRSIKGVTGLDLTQLLIGSEGTLAVTVGATVCLRPLPVARRTVLARFPTVADAAHGVGGIARSPVRPAATELLDAGTLEDIDLAQGTRLAHGTEAILLLELDGYGIEEQTADLERVLARARGTTRVIADEDEAEHLWELRRSGRQGGPPRVHLGEDIAVPASRLPEVFEALARIGETHGVRATALAHAGDGNLHPSLSLPIDEADATGGPPPALLAAADELVRTALALGGTISGEHGIGTAKQHWLPLELSETSRALQHDIKHVLDPHGILNPGRAL
ncbi:FAD-binding oxidoreductase [Brachybacterium sp. AOP25-B2-12]|uniref:FAD-binding oxidoreductase n=1 Tax=Brachybacterium sp. AOP25-B2-12 TaxID=3457710 RepID=UPI00403438AC